MARGTNWKDEKSPFVQAGEARRDRAREAAAAKTLTHDPRWREEDYRA